MVTRLQVAFGAILVGLAVLAPDPAKGAPAGAELPIRELPAAPGRLIVKYRPQVSTCAHCLVEKGIPFASVTGTDSLDRLNHQLGVSAARALAFDDHRHADDRSKAYFDRLARVQSRFAARTARATPTALLPDLSNVFVLDLPKGMDLHMAAALYAADPSVEYVHLDYELRTTVIPNDPFLSSYGTWNQSYPDLWGLHVTSAPAAWDTATGAGKVVAVIDTGVDYTHLDLAANIWVNTGEIPGNGIDDDGNGFVDDIRGWDFVGNSNNPTDRHGHGTHVAGTVAAVGNNGVGIAGMAWGARVMAIKGLNDSGLGRTSDLARSVLYAAENGADVLNASWGGFSFNLVTGSPSALRDAVETASALGVVVVAAAGNNAGNVSSREPAGYPTVIAVGATNHSDARAAFSNRGNALSVMAPGVDILSLRSAVSSGVNSAGSVVASQYLRLNGTSMASPHAAGLSAVLLSALPDLEPDEVRWHLELNADQPGYPGYEGELWNPYFGYGRINAAQVFDTPPVTTRLGGRADLHAYVGTVIPDQASANLQFTTLDPVPWNLSSPAWLPASSAAGDGPAAFSFSVDTTGLMVGHHAGDVAIDAPGAVDGGDSFGVELQTHADPRSGEIVTLTDEYVANSVAPGGVPVVADGTGALVVWAQWTPWPPRLYAARLDGAGNLHGPYLVHTNPPGVYHTVPAVAFDGRNYLLVWNNTEYVSSFRRSRYRNTVMVLRVSPSGEALDAAPTVLMHREDRGNLFIRDLKAAFDGEAYTVIRNEYSFANFRGKVYAQRLGPDGTLRGKARKLYPNKLTVLSPAKSISPDLACTRQGCLLTWGVRSGIVTPAGYFLDRVYGIRLAGSGLVGNPFQILSNINLGLGSPQVINKGDEYLVAAGRLIECEGVFCGRDYVAARVTSSGIVRDPDPLRLNATSPLQGVGSASVTTDGENYLASFIGGGSRPGTQIFGFRVGPDGEWIDADETPGRLLLPDSLGKVPAAYGTSMAQSIVGTPTHATVIWVDTLNFNPGSSTVSWTSPISAQRALPRAAPAGLASVEIGAIGPRSVQERTELAFALTASTLDAANTTFSASNLPPGARLDPTGIFRWTPSGRDAGVYAGVHFEATDGVEIVSEDVTLTVTEANLSLAGTVTLSDATPVAGVALKLAGPVRGWTVATDAAGRFQFEDLVPGNYRVRLARPSTRQYTAVLSAARATLAGSDVAGVNLVVLPR